MPGLRSLVRDANLCTEGRGVRPLCVDDLGRRRIGPVGARRRRQHLRRGRHQGFGVMGSRRRLSCQRPRRSRFPLHAADDDARDHRNEHARGGRPQCEHLPPVCRLQLRGHRRAGPTVRADWPRRHELRQCRLHRTRCGASDAEPDAVLHNVGCGHQDVSLAECRDTRLPAVDADLHQDGFRRLVVRPVLGLLCRRRSAVFEPAALRWWSDREVLGEPREDLMRMLPRRSSWLIWILSAAIALPQGATVTAQSPQTKPAAATAPPPGTNADTGWPRTVALKGGMAQWYQPQIESWIDQKNIVAWSAVSYLRTGAKEPALGTIKIEGPTQVAVDDRVVTLDLRISQYNFPSLSPEETKQLVADVQMLPVHQRVLDLDRLLAYAAASPLQVKNADNIKADPPKVFSSTTPAILVNLDGETVWSPIKDVDLQYVLNTNWDVLQYTPTKTLYLRDNKSWLEAKAIEGPWTPAGKLPESFSKLPADDNWKDVKAAVPGERLSAKAVPKVFVSTQPAELIALDGAPKYQKVEGTTTLLWVSNTESDL